MTYMLKQAARRNLREAQTLEISGLRYIPSVDKRSRAAFGRLSVMKVSTLTTLVATLLVSSPSLAAPIRDDMQIGTLLAPSPSRRAPSRDDLQIATLLASSSSRAAPSRDDMQSTFGISLGVGKFNDPYTPEFRDIYDHKIDAVGDKLQHEFSSRTLSIPVHWSCSVTSSSNSPPQLRELIIQIIHWHDLSANCSADIAGIQQPPLPPSFVVDPLLPGTHESSISYPLDRAEPTLQQLCTSRLASTSFGLCHA